MDNLRARLNGLARKAAHRHDVIVAIFLLMALVMMVIPLPTMLVDVLIALNISLSLLVLVTSFYIGRPAAFSSLPPIILIATLFRLALSISTTRLILLHADAGRIVETFGRFVIGGEVVVGLVIFLIITAAQFIVITKGAERVAEVAARFTLDAMPGKQMAIDNDLRNGDIDQAEARARRARLERESQLYGAMDGAMKFVKGDSITGLIIVCVNLLGGLMIGMLGRGMDFGQAGHTYSLLTVGDGLIAQIPALLISMAAGTTVTRVASDADEDLGTEIVRQLGASQRALTLAALVTCGAALVPGFPTFIFLAIGGTFGAIAYVMHKRTRAGAQAEAAQEGDSDAPSDEAPLSADGDGAPLPAAPSLQRLVSAGPTRVRIVAHTGQELARCFSRQAFEAQVDGTRERILEELGLQMPAVALQTDLALAPDRLRIDLEGVPVVDVTMPADALMLDDDPAHLDLLGLAATAGPSFAWAERTFWVEAEHGAALREAGIAVLSPVAVFGRCIDGLMRRHAAHFLGLQETREWLAGFEHDFADLVQEATRLVPLQKLSDILRRLVEEDVSIGHGRIILEALVEHGAQDHDAQALADLARVALSRQICHRRARLERVIMACVLTRDVEQVLRNGTKRRANDRKVSLAPDLARAIIAQMHDQEAGATQGALAMLVAADIRRSFRNFLVQNGVHWPVLSYQEIAPDFSVQTIGAIAPPPQPEATALTSSLDHADPAPDGPAHAFAT